MPGSHGRQKKAEKHRKRRQARRRTPLPRGRVAGASSPPRVDLHNTPLADELAATIGYDANRQPGAAAWLALGEQERLDRIAEYHHYALPSVKLPPSISRHAGMHGVVENQLALDDPPAAALALLRLMAEGLSRHDALHAVGWVLAEHMLRAVKMQTPVDAAAYARDLTELTLARWLAMASAKG